MKERDFQRSVIDLAEILGWRVYHVADVRGRLRSGSGVGFPDLVMVSERQRKTLFRELKTDTGEITEAQAGWLAALQAAGMDADVWRPHDFHPPDRRIEAELRGTWRHPAARVRK